jgi:hypothetical protein
VSAAGPFMGAEWNNAIAPGRFSSTVRTATA